MSLIDRLENGQNAAGAPQMDPRQMLQQLRTDPVGVLKQRGLNIPQGMNNPQQIIQHLVQSGQVSNPRLQQAMQMLGRR